MTTQPEKKTWWVMTFAPTGDYAGSSGPYAQTLAEFVEDVRGAYGLYWGERFDIREASEGEIKSIPQWVHDLGAMKKEALAIAGAKGELSGAGAWCSMREICGWNFALMLYSGKGKPHFHLAARKANGEIAMMNELNFVGLVLSCLGAVPPPMPVNGAPTPDGTWRFTWLKNRNGEL